MEQLVLLLSIFVVVWIAVYLRNNGTSIEPFGSLPMRKCTVWFTDDIAACNEGLFHKDTRSVKYIRDRLIKNRLDEVTRNTDLFNSNQTIINDYKGMSVRAIRDKVRAVSSQIIAQEKSKLTNRNQDLIDIHQGYLDNIDWWANYYFRNVPRMEIENIRLTIRNANLRTEIASIEASNIYKNINATLQVKEANPNFRCKNEYDGWDEQDSSTNTLNNDPIKKVSSIATRGDPYGWATCTKMFSSAADKSKELSYIENKQFPDIEIDNRPIFGLTAEQQAVTGQIRFHKFNQADTLVCDDKLVKPNMPSIPNGLLQILVDSKDIIQSIKVVKYENDSRYISDKLTKNIGEIDGQLIRNLFFDTIYEAWPTQQLYIYPKKGKDVIYRVNYVYYDNKCKRFFPSTTKPRGVSVGGDIMPVEPPHVLYANSSQQFLFERSIKNKSVPTRYYIDDINPSSLSIFKTIRDGIDKEIKDAEGKKSQLEGQLSKNIGARDYFLYRFNREPVYVRDCGRWAWSRCKWRINRRKIVYKTLYQFYVNRVNIISKELNGTAIPKLNSFYARRTAFNKYINELDNSARSFSTSYLQNKLQSFVGKPASEFIGRYNPSYISNNNTIYLRIHSKSKKNEYYFLDDVGREVTNPAEVLTLYGIDEDENIDYENIFIGEDIDPDNFIYIPETYNISADAQAAMKTSYAVLYDKDKYIVGEYTDYGTYDLSEINMFESPILTIDIAPGVRIDVVNGSNLTNSYDNSPDATSVKNIKLTSAMTSGTCNEKDEIETTCLMTKIIIRPY